MKFWEAMKLLQEGKKVRATHWDKGGWMDKSSIEMDIPHTLRFLALNYEWELYEDPATHALHLKCLDCGMTDFVLFKDAKDWKCPACSRKTLTFMDVVKGLKEGKKFKRKNSDEWLEQMILGLHLKSPLLDSDEIFSLTLSEMAIEDFEATDWVEVKE